MKYQIYIESIAVIYVIVISFDLDPTNMKQILPSGSCFMLAAVQLPVPNSRMRPLKTPSCCLS